LGWRQDDPSLLTLADKGYLVFGGDAPDKGPGDIRVTRALVCLQRQEPERVFLLVGNRDANKLRLAAELAEGELPDVDPVRYLDAVSWQGVKQQFAEYLRERKLERTPFAGLQWLVEKTLGANTLLATRRMELEVLGRPANDQDLLRSFAELVDPKALEPWTLEYLRVAKVMLLIGDCVFIHGAILSRGLLLLPAEDCRDGALEGQPPPLRLPKSTPLEDWAAELNGWKVRQLRLFEAYPHFQKDKEVAGQRWRGGQPLMMPSLAGCHVVTDGFLVRGNGAPLDSDVAEYLASNGVRRVFAGHQPQGQSPGVVRNPETGITVLVADTSFSDMAADKSRNPADNRGAAVSMVTVRWDRTVVQGQLADGSEHRFTLHLDWAADDPAAALVGRQLNNYSWGRTVVKGQLQTCYGEGFNLQYSFLDPEAARARLREPYVLA